MSAPNTYLSPAVAGSGTIAIGLAASATALGEVKVLARSDASAWRAEEQAERQCKRVDGADGSKLKVTTEIGDLAGCDLVVEAIAEDREAKAKLLAALAAACPESDLATTTSSLGIAELGERAGASGRFYGLHVLNPVARMELVELCLPAPLDDGVAERARGFCEALGKRAIEVPDQAGFVVNRLLFPYLFDAVRLLERTGMEADDVDVCMTLGASHPMGPLKLLDFVGVDVAIAIGRSLHEASGETRDVPPPMLERMADEQRLGRKSGTGFYDY